MPKIIAALIATYCLLSSALADNVTSQHGGRAVEAGPYHVELVAKADVIDVYLADHSNKPVTSAGHKAVAIFAEAGKSVRVTLEPAGANRLTGQATEKLSEKPKGAVRVTRPDGKTVQAKFD